VQKSRLIFLPILILMVMAIPAATQPIGEMIDFGFGLGPAISTASGHQNESRSRTGLSIGGWLGYRQNKFFTLRIELLYISKGYRLDNVVERDSLGNVIGQSDLEFIFNYLEMPLLAKFTAPVRGKYIPYLLAGGFAAYNTDNRMRLLEGIPLDFDLENANKVDVGAIIGAGIDMVSGPGRLVFETRYEISFSKTIKNQNQKLRTLAFHLGYGW